MSPTSTQRPLTKRSETTQKRIVRYYISQQALKHGFKSCPNKSVNAEHLDELVRTMVLDHLAHDPILRQTAEVRDHWIRAVIREVTLSESRLVIHLDAAQIEALRQHDFSGGMESVPPRPTCHHKPEVEDRGRTIRLALDIQIKKHDGRRLLLSPEGDDLVLPSVPEPTQHLVDAVGLAYRWHDELCKTGEPIAAFARRLALDETRVHRLLPLTCLGPVVLKAILTGSHPPRLTLGDLLQAAKQTD